MKLKDHQLIAVKKALDILINKKLVYIFGQPRVGKSLISLDLAKQYLLYTNNTSDVNNDNQLSNNKIIVFTKKSAINDWLKYQNDYNFDITNYEQVINKDNNHYQIIIIDEAHNFGTFPKPSLRIKQFKQFCKNKILIYLSGTPLVENLNSIYSQLSLSSYSPFANYKNAYAYFKDFGEPDTIYLYGRQVESYKKAKKEKVLNCLSPYIVKVTYNDANFNYNNIDKVYLITSNDTKNLLDKLNKDLILYDKKTNKELIVLDSIAKQIQANHRIVGGYYENVKIPQAKLKWLIDFINSKPLNSKIAIMCYFREEQENILLVLKNYCENQNLKVFSSVKYCEGIDLSNYNHFILYSFGYSGAKFIQLRDRIVNINNNKQTEVIIPLIKDTIDINIYKAVSNKKSVNINILYKSLQNNI